MRYPALTAFLIAGAVQAAPETLGRLFFSPEERVMLEQQRRLELGEGDGVMLNGVVRSRGGSRSTLWLNGSPWHGVEASLAGNRRSDPSTAVWATDRGEVLRLRVGERTEPRRSGFAAGPEAVRDEGTGKHGPPSR